VRTAPSQTGVVLVALETHGQTLADGRIDARVASTAASCAVC